MYIPVNPSQQIQNFKFVAMDLELMGGALYLKPFTRGLSYGYKAL